MTMNAEEHKNEMKTLYPDDQDLKPITKLKTAQGMTDSEIAGKFGQGVLEEINADLAEHDYNPRTGKKLTKEELKKRDEEQKRLQEEAKKQDEELRKNEEPRNADELRKRDELRRNEELRVANLKSPVKTEVAPNNKNKR